MLRPKGIRTCVWALLAISSLFIVLRSAAQSADATLSGIITDQTGSQIPGANVSIKNVDNGDTREIITNRDGVYSAPGLAPGQYDVAVSAPGFSKVIQKEILLTVGSERTLDVNLRLGQVNQTVEVNETTESVDTSSSSLSSTVGEKAVEDLPLNGRSWTQLATLQMGVTSIRTQAPIVGGSSRGNRGYGDQLSDSGHRPNENTYRIDGINVNDYTNGAPGSAVGLALGVDAIREFSVITTNYTAEYGRTSGAIINAITKSGANQFHGSGYFFDRDKIFDARNFFDPGGTIPPFRRIQFGGSAGGPIIKNKTFIFGDYEGIRQDQSISFHQIVFSDAARAGNLCSIPNGKCVPHTLSGSLNPDPATGIDQAVLPYLGLYPRPNGGAVPGGNGDTGFFNAGGLISVKENYFTFRIDHKLTNSDNLGAVYFYDKTPQNIPDPLLNIISQNYTGRQMVGLTESHIFTASLLNTARVGYSRNVGIVLQPVKAINPVAGDTALAVLPGLLGSPTIGISGLSVGQGLGAPPNFYHHWNSYQAGDDLFLTKGRHSLKFGFAFERMQYNALGLQSRNGGFTFSGLSGHPNALENFLTNRPKQVQLLSPTVSREIGSRDSLYGGYVQDDWRAKPRLTLNMGLRYEMLTNPTEAHDRFGDIGNLYTGTTQSIKTRFQVNPTRLNFDPRVGFAWDVFGTGKMAIRGGFGIFDVLPLPYVYTNRDAFSLPNAALITVSKLPQGAFPKNFPLSFDPKKETVRYVNPQHRSYAMNWNLSIENALTSHLKGTVAYVGSHGVHEPTAMDDANQVLATLIDGVYSWPCDLTLIPQGIPCTGGGTKLNPNVGAIQPVFFDGLSKYHGLQTQLQLRNFHGVQGQISYTFGKCLDDGSGGQIGDPFQNSLSSLIFFDGQHKHGPCDFDIRQSLTGNVIYEIPGPKTGSASWILGGWQVGGIIIISTGSPFTMVLDGDPLGQNSSDPYDYPSRKPGCNPINSNFKANGLLYLNLSCFTLPGAPTSYSGPCGPFLDGQGLPIVGTCQNLLGNSGRNQLYGPKLVNVDLSLFKNLSFPKISENFKLQFRIEMFNAFNHANFLPPTDNNVFLFDDTTGQLSGAGGTGQLTKTATSSRQIQFGAKVIW